MDIADITFTHAPIGLCMLEDRIIKGCNLAFGEMFKVRPQDCHDRPLADFYPSLHDFEVIGERVLAGFQETGTYDDERVMKRSDGDLFWCRVRGKSLTPDAPFQRSIWSMADLSDERPLVALTQREREVAIFTCRGMTSKEVALQLGLSHRTVEEYRARLLKKFGARKLAELVAKLSGMPL